jgi:hypothetical protein
MTKDRVELVRFQSKVDRRGPDDCWEWRGSQGTRGYGSFRTDGKTVRAHRMAYELARGPIPDGMMICHHCDNPPCCNPAHLFLGTAGDNVRDMVAKGRNRRRSDESGVRFARGEDHGSAKLTAPEVLEIRRRVSAGERQTEIAKELGVDKGLIWQIKERRIWTHV